MICEPFMMSEKIRSLSLHAWPITWKLRFFVKLFHLLFFYFSLNFSHLMWIQIVGNRAFHSPCEGWSNASGPQPICRPNRNRKDGIISEKLFEILKRKNKLFWWKYLKLIQLLILWKKNIPKMHKGMHVIKKIFSNWASLRSVFRASAFSVCNSPNLVITQWK